MKTLWFEANFYDIPQVIYKQLYEINLATVVCSTHIHIIYICVTALNYVYIYVYYIVHLQFLYTKYRPKV